MNTRLPTLTPSSLIGAAALLAALVVAPGCDGYLDINEDPNNPTQVPVSALLASTTFATGNNVFSGGDIASNYVQHLASPNRASATDVYERVSFDGTWGNIYDTMNDLQLLEAQAQEGGASDYVGISRVLQALHLGLLVDFWGDVPYSEAFNPGETLNPGYDDASALYDEIFRLLEGGIAALGAGNSTSVPRGDDFIYGGDTDLWTRAAYALRARYLNHLTGTGSYDPSAVLAAVDQAFTSEAENMTLVYPDDQQNPWASVAIANANLFLGGWISEQFIQALDGTTYGVFDPRIEAYTDALEDGSYLGTENGAGRGDASEAGDRSVLTTSTYYAAVDAPLEIITYGEVKMIEAEAALRAGQSERAYAAYLEAIRAHMAKLGVADDEAEAYIDTGLVSPGAGDLSLDDIFREKYKILFLNPEAWVDARRYNYAYEDFTLPANSELSTFILRLDYPDTEYSRNASNVPQTSLTSPIFWDQ